MKCEDCGKTRAKGPPRRIRMTVNAAAPKITACKPEEVGQSVERTVCNSCFHFRDRLSYLDVEVIDLEPTPYPVR